MIIKALSMNFMYIYIKDQNEPKYQYLIKNVKTLILK